MGSSRSLGTLLRHLIELLDGDVEAAYREAGFNFRARYTPVMRRLIECGPSSIRAIANSAGITHSAASQTVAEMIKRGLVRSDPGDDGRERIVQLTELGEATVPELKRHWQAINAAAADLGRDVGYSLEDVIQRTIAAVEERSFLDRINQARRAGQRRAGSR